MWERQCQIWEELLGEADSPQMLGGTVKKDVGGAESRFGRKCSQMLGGRVKKDVGGVESRFGRKCPQMLGGTVKKDMEGA